MAREYLLSMLRQITECADASVGCVESVDWDAEMAEALAAAERSMVELRDEIGHDTPDPNEPF